MESFKVHILGCGSALPTLRHNPSSQLIEIREKFFMVDCGEGTQIQLRRSRTHFSRISAVFISHLHGDHCFGLIGMISTFGMLGRTAPLHIYATAEFKPMLDAQMEMFCRGLSRWRLSLWTTELPAADTFSEKKAHYRTFVGI